MVATSAEVGPEVDEFDLVHLAKAPARRVRAPRIANASVAMEVKLVSHQQVGRDPADLFLLEVVYWHIDEAVLSGGRVDPHKLQAVGRLGGLGYCDTAVTFELKRPGRG